MLSNRLVQLPKQVSKLPGNGRGLPPRATLCSAKCAFLANPLGDTAESLRDGLLGH